MLDRKSVEYKGVFCRTALQRRPTAIFSLTSCVRHYATPFSFCCYWLPNYARGQGGNEIKKLTFSLCTLTNNNDSTLFMPYSYKIEIWAGFYIPDTRLDNLICWKKDSVRLSGIRPHKFFLKVLFSMILKKLAKYLSALAILGHSKRISPGTIRSKVGHQKPLNSRPGSPILEHIALCEILSEWPKIARSLRFWPIFFLNLETKISSKNFWAPH